MQSWGKSNSGKTFSNLILCLVQDFVCDASMWYRQRTGGKVNGCIQNGGSVRANISAGEITRGDVLTAFPFGDVSGQVYILSTFLTCYRLSLTLTLRDKN